MTVPGYVLQEFMDQLPDDLCYNFQQWLQSTKDLQLLAYDLDWAGFVDANGQINEQGRGAFIDRGVFAAIAELVELSQEVGWKPWATDRSVDRAKVIGEAVDVMHFLANILVMVHCTGDELTDYYREKQVRNLRRQIDGYTGEKDDEGREIDRPMSHEGPTDTCEHPVCKESRSTPKVIADGGSNALRPGEVPKYDGPRSTRVPQEILNRKHER